MMPRRSAGVVSSPLADQVVVHDPRRGVVHLLNAAGAVVWDACDGQTTAAGLVDLISDVTGADPAAVAADVASHVTRLEREGLVGREEPAPEPWRPPSELIEGHRSTRSFAVLDDAVAFRSDDAGLVAAINDLLASLVADRPPTALYGITTREAGAIRVVGRGHDEVVTSRSGLLELVPSLLNRVATSSTSCLAVHSAAVGSPSGSVLLLPAPSGAGKSTLAAALVQRGWDYLTDEAVGVRPTLDAVAYPKPLALDAASRAVIGLRADLGPHVRPDELRRRAAVAVDAVARVGAVLFPAFRSGATSTVVVPMTPGEAVIELASHALNLAATGQIGLDALAAVAGGVPSARLVHGGVDRAAPLITQWASSWPFERLA